MAFLETKSGLIEPTTLELQLVDVAGNCLDTIQQLSVMSVQSQESSTVLYLTTATKLTT